MTPSYLRVIMENKTDTSDGIIGMQLEIFKLPLNGIKNVDDLAK